MTARIFIKLIAGLCAMLAISLFLIDFMTSRVVESTYMANRWRELEDKASILELSSASALADPLNIRSIAEATGARITLIARDGNVIADSAANPAELADHAPAFAKA